jgi:uncharacterized membrane protein
MNKALAFMLGKGYWLMGIGMALALCGIVIMMEPRNRVGPMRQAGIGIGIAGFVVYFVGRVLVAIERRKPRKSSSDNTE